MITFDGNRSKGKLWFAKKQIDVIRSVDVPAKTVVLDGFKVSVWQQDDLSGGRITAPMGAVVMLSSPDGIKMAAMENWLGGCTSYGSLHLAAFASGVVGVVFRGADPGVSEYGVNWEVVESDPVLFDGYFYVDGGGYEAVQQYPGAPSITPYYGAEGYTITNCGVQNWGFFDYVWAESVLTGYNSDNSNWEGRYSVAAFGNFASQMTCINMPGNQCISYINERHSYHSDDRIIANSDFACAIHQYRGLNEETGMDEQKADPIWLADVVPNGSVMPDGLRTLMLDVPKSNIIVIGGYSFINSSGKLVYMHAAYFSYTHMTVDETDGDLSPIKDWFDDNDDKTDWRIFLSVLVRDITVKPNVDIVNLYNLSDFGVFLNAKSTMDIYNGSADKNVVALTSMLSYLFPYPNEDGVMDLRFAWKPYDSVMFHGPYDSAFVWTRAYGSTEINATTCMTDIALTVPTEVVTTEGVRPDIQYCGNDLYFCACNKVKDSILAMYIGTPFPGAVDPGWTKLANPSEGILVHVRPVTVTTEDIFLIGVVKVQVDVDGTMEDKYRFASFRKQGAEAPGEWSLMALLPFTVGDSDNFASCLYGNNPMVTALLNHPSPQHATPPSLVGPYENYKEWTP